MFDRLAYVQKHCLASISNNICGEMFLNIFKNMFCFPHTKNVGRALFLDVAKRSNILLDKQISKVGPTIFDLFARAIFHEFPLSLPLSEVFVVVKY